MNIYFTFDYELFFGQNSGTAQNSIIKPTDELLNIAAEHNVKFTFFVDSGYLIKLKEYKKYKYVENEYNLVYAQLEKMVKLGHSIQLHIHPHWEDSFFDGEKWIINTSRYRLYQFDENEIEEIVTKYVKILKEFYDNIFAYRAGGWCIQPFDKIKNALKKNNIWLDSTVFYGGYNKSTTHYYDFRNAPKKDGWRFEDDPLVEDNNGFFKELPISSIKYSPLFYWKFAYTKKRGRGKFKIFGDGSAVGASKKDIIKMLIFPSWGCVSCDGFRSSMLNDAYKKYIKNQKKNFVIIGHPKGQSLFSLKIINKFIKNKNISFFRILD